MSTKLKDVLSSSKEKKEAANIEQTVAQSHIGLQQAQLNNRSAVSQVKSQLNNALYGGNVIDWNEVAALQGKLNSLEEGATFLAQCMDNLF